MQQESAVNNKRIAKNTILLYFRMLFLMVITLYTSRVILQVLGVVDFGIYNVVGGIVVLFTFISGPLADATRRFMTFELGKNNIDALKKVFSTSIYIHVLFSLIILFLSETIGLWFLYTQLNIPPERFNAALYVYQYSVLATIVTILQTPYTAAIIAHEEMQPFETEGTELLARAICHELDHLDGIMYVTKVEGPLYEVSNEEEGEEE